MEQKRDKRILSPLCFNLRRTKRREEGGVKGGRRGKNGSHVARLLLLVKGSLRDHWHPSFGIHMQGESFVMENRKPGKRRHSNPCCFNY
jgi:hypothetical protein